MPYWSKKPYPGVELVPLHTFAEALAAEHDAQLQDISNQIVTCQLELEAATASGAAAGGHGSSLGNPMAPPTKGKGKQPDQQHKGRDSVA